MVNAFYAWFCYCCCWNATADRNLFDKHICVWTRNLRFLPVVSTNFENNKSNEIGSLANDANLNLFPSIVGYLSCKRWYNIRQLNHSYFWSPKSLDLINHDPSQWSSMLLKQRADELLHVFSVFVVHVNLKRTLRASHRRFVVNRRCFFFAVAMESIVGDNV